MTVNSDRPAVPSTMPGQLFLRVLVNDVLRCSSCGHEAAYQIPEVIDWRDREAVELLRRCSPAVRCRACTADVPLERPVVVMRPGDPIPLLAGFPRHTPLDRDTGALLAVLRHSRMTALASPSQAVPLPTDLGHLGSLADKYTGFVLAGLDEIPGEDWSAADRVWIEAVRDHVTVPDLVSEFTTFIQIRGGEWADAAARQSAGLLHPAWVPVVDELVERTVAMQTDSEVADIVRRRALALRRLRWGPLPRTGEEDLDERGSALLAEATRGSQRLSQGDVEAIWKLVQQLRDAQHRGPLLTAALISFVAAAVKSPSRTPADLERAATMGVEAVTRAGASFGPRHPVTLTAKRDYAAALLEQQQGVPSDNEQKAMTLLAEVAAAEIESGSHDLPDTLQNWAAALAHHTLRGRTDNQERALHLYRDALHAQRVLRPRDRRGTVLIRLNTAAALRERREGNASESTRQSVDTYLEILNDPDATQVLDAAEVTQAWANLVTALFQLHGLAPDEVAVADVAAVANGAAQHGDDLSEGDPVRIRSLSNIGTVLGELYQVSFQADTPDVSLLEAGLRLTGLAHHEARRWLHPDHDERVRVGLNYAVNLARPRANGRTDAAAAERLLRELLAAAESDRMAGHRYAIARNLGQLHCGRGQWKEAAAMFETSLAAVHRLYRDARTRLSQLAELGIAADLAGWLVVTRLSEGDVAGAVDALERSRVRLLSDPAGRGHASAGAIPDPPASDRPVLYVGVGALASWVILVQPGKRPLGLRTALTADKLRPLVAEVRRAGTSSRLAGALDAVAAALQPAILMSGRIVMQENGIDDLDVVPSGLLGGLPLHALPTGPSTDACWLDQAVIRYIPSRRVAAGWRTRGNGASVRSVLALADPSGDLDCARYEPMMIPARLGIPIPMPSGGDQVQWLLDSLRVVSHAHLACHAHWNPDEPLLSEIDVGHPHRITLDELLGIDCGALDLAVLSCCSTGVPVEALSDELLGFGSGMLLAGARAVVVSNWDIGDLSSSLVMASFYRLLDDRKQPAAALRSAQLWVAGCTMAELERLVHEAFDGEPDALLPAGLAAQVVAGVLMQAEAAPGHRPFRHPAHWAGYSYHGPALQWAEEAERSEWRTP